MIDWLIRFGRPAALLAAVIGVAGDIYHFTLDDRSEVATSLGYRFHGIALMLAMLLAIFALIRLALVADARWGLVGKLGFVLALAGTITTFGDIWAEVIVLPGVTESAPKLLDADAAGFHLAVLAGTFLGLFALGWLLVGVASLRAGLGSRLAAGLLIPAAVIAGLPLGGSYILLLVMVAWLSWSVPNGR
jgi:hypothetical protein